MEAKAFHVMRRVAIARQNLDEITNNADKIIAAADMIRTALNNEKKLILFGNGGSAADSQHIAAEFIGVGLPAIALTTDSSVLTALANDISVDKIFAFQVQALSCPGDIVIGISTSGRSLNVIEGLREAQNRKCKVIALVGDEGGFVEDYVSRVISVDAGTTAQVQELHIMIGHLIFELVTK
jgi:D-sedoheptulose 7-phosphate isomerase